MGSCPCIRTESGRECSRLYYESRRWASVGREGPYGLCS